MTELQRKTVKLLREAGLSYHAIAAKTGISHATIKSFILRHNIVFLKPEKDTCLNCGKHTVSLPGKRQRKFCSRECGLEWWHTHSELLDKKAVYSFVCPACSKEFKVYGQRDRIYCSHPCYIHARFRGNIDEIQ